MEDAIVTSAGTFFRASTDVNQNLRYGGNFYEQWWDSTNNRMVAMDADRNRSVVIRYRKDPSDVSGQKFANFVERYDWTNEGQFQRVQSFPVHGWSKAILLANQLWYAMASFEQRTYIFRLTPDTLLPVINESADPTPSPTPMVTPTPTPTTTPVTTPRPTSPNVVVNGGFELDGIRGWAAWQPNGQSSKFGVDGNDRYEGRNKLYFWSDTTYKQSIHQVISNLTNGWYTFSCMVKLSAYGDQPRTARIELQSSGSPDQFYNVQPTGQWTKHTLRVYVKSGQIDIGFYVDSPGKTSMQIDDVQLRAE
jgi:Carbohydrate binding domain